MLTLPIVMTLKTSVSNRNSSTIFARQLTTLPTHPLPSFMPSRHRRSRSPSRALVTPRALTHSVPLFTHPPVSARHRLPYRTHSHLQAPPAASSSPSASLPLPPSHAPTARHHPSDALPRSRSRSRSRSPTLLRPTVSPPDLRFAACIRVRPCFRPACHSVPPHVSALLAPLHVTTFARTVRFCVPRYDRVVNILASSGISNVDRPFARLLLRCHFNLFSIFHPSFTVRTLFLLCVIFLFRVSSTYFHLHLKKNFFCHAFPLNFSLLPFQELFSRRRHRLHSPSHHIPAPFSNFPFPASTFAPLRTTTRGTFSPIFKFCGESLYRDDFESSIGVTHISALTLPASFCIICTAFARNRVP